jgi:hypothetical protein
MRWLLGASLAAVVGATAPELTCLAGEQRIGGPLAASPITERADVDLPTAFEVTLTEPPAHAVLTQ